MPTEDDDWNAASDKKTDAPAPKTARTEPPKADKPIIAHGLNSDQMEFCARVKEKIDKDNRIDSITDYLAVIEIISELAKKGKKPVSSDFNNQKTVDATAEWILNNKIDTLKGAA